MEIQFRALATDYDGTLATQGTVENSVVAALQRWLSSGHRALLVTGRQLPDLRQAFPGFHLFERVIAENGALLYRTATDQELLLCEPPPVEFVGKLQERGVPISIGQAVVASRSSHHNTVLEVIRELGLDLRVTFNKGDLMVLPPGVTKASGLKRALDEMALVPDSVIGIGDAENDHDFLAMCGCAVAVANALPSLKSSADLVTLGAHGAGVVEVIERLLAGDFDCNPRRGDLR